MSQIIEELKNEVGQIKFRKLSDKKISFEYRIPIISQDITLFNISIKIIYKRNPENWTLISPKENFINQLSISNSIKKKNISFNILFTDKKIVVDNEEYLIKALMTHIKFNDLNWHKEQVVRKHREKIIENLIG